ncbi:MAG: 50S ribosomal protein L35 [Dehalococcoidia bacterium]|nr:50S ribosomal protein L35 [Dehalococcoidia bacterium]
MPKLKTHKGVKGRFHITGSGKLMRTKCGKSHLRRKKAPRTKRLYDEMIPVSSADKKRIGRLLPYK